MRKNIDSNGFAHLLALIAGITAVVLVLTLTVSTKYLNRVNDDSLTFFGETEGVVAGAMAPTGQLAAIAKAECDIFVSTNGNTSNNGRSETTPMQNIASAVNAAGPGESVCIKGGEYRQVVRINNKHGTSSAPIKLGGYTGGGLPIVSGGHTKNDEFKLPDPNCRIKDVCSSGNTSGAGSCRDRDSCTNQPLFVLSDSSYIHVIGIDVRGSSGRGFAVSDSNYMYVKGLRSYHHWDTGVQIASDRADTGIRNDFELMAVYDTVRAMPENKLIGGGAIHVNKIKSGSIKKTLVFENFGEGLDVHKNSSNFEVSQSMFWDNYHAFLYPNGGVNVTLNGNFLFCTGNRVKWLEENGVKPGSNTGYGTAITVRNEKGVTGKHGEGSGTIVSNNLIVGCTGSIIVASQSGASLTDVKVLNNTVVSPRNFPSGNGYEGKTGEALTVSGSVSNIVVANNVFLSDSTGGSINGGSADNATYSNNIVSKAASINKPGIIIQNPVIQRNVGVNEILNPATIKAPEYNIMSNSPAVNRGQAVANSRNTLDKDFFDNSRNATSLDAGAYESGMPKNWTNLYNVIMSGASSGGEETDSDGDGVPNSSDQCPTVSSGTNPDPTRLGCPSTTTPPADNDGDGIPNSSDQCPNRAAGTNPDPARPGCPLDITQPVDGDGDGFSDTIDQCPTISSGANPDPARPGCPLEAEVETTNIILNSNFNEGPNEIYKIADNWTFTKGRLVDASATLSRARQTDLAKAEAIVVKVVSRGPLGLYPALHQKDLAIKPNTTYTLTFAAKASMPSELTVEIRDMNLVETKLASKLIFNLSQGWKIYTAEIRTTNFSSEKLGKITFGFKLPDGGSSFIDNITLVPVE